MEEIENREKREWLDRTRYLIGDKAVEKLINAKVIVYGIGGVGSFVCEGLVRSGIGNIVIVDNDYIDITNINRQIHANIKTIGLQKNIVMEKRLKEINPNLNIESYMAKDLEKEENLIDNTFDYVIDAVDTVTTKLKLIQKTKEKNVPIISCMGTGNKLDPTQFQIADINKTSVCPLAKVMRKELRKRNIEKIKVLYSKEEPKKVKKVENIDKSIPASIAFVPSVAGLIISGEVVKDIIKEDKNDEK